MKGTPLKLHANVPGSVEINVNVALVLLVGSAGTEVIVVSGGVVSSALIIQL